MGVIKSLAAVAALSLVNSAQAWYNELPPCLAPFDPFVYTGCYDNGQRGQKEALTLRTDLDVQNMTVETCVSECKGNGYRLAGLSYYGVCYCGQTVSTALLEEDQCSFACTGNSSQSCGGDTQINIWMDPTFPPIEQQNDISEYVPVGCWTDDSSEGRALFYRQDNVDASTMTTDSCLKSCLNGGFPFAGTEYGGECYCGVVVGNGTQLATDAETCNVPCNGNKNQVCGGPSRLSLYVAKDLQSLEPCGSPPDTSSTISSYPVSSTSAPTSSSTIISYPVSSSTSSVTPTSEPVSSSTSSISSYPVSSTTSSESSTSAPISTTTPPPTSTSSTTKSATSTTSSAAVCTTTIVTPPTCEYKCGKWCSNPIPDWNDHGSCLVAWSQCLIQTASCFLQAGFPDSLHCFEFGEWCADVETYCHKKCLGGHCGKSDCFNSTPPKGSQPPVTHTSTIPCPTTTTTSTKKTSTKTTTTTTKAGYPTSSCPVPTPTGICVQPSNSKYGYKPGHPVGGIELPVVTCNNIKADYSQGNVFKLYTDKDSRKCPSYPRPDCNNACLDACDTQFQQCEAVYAQGCRTETSRRFSQNYKDADAACRAQHADCIHANKDISGKGHCKTWQDAC
ncbi:WSC domain-containing protein [Poronia punctata]|nr:WSC domain-containing protein [Poronia punctata]